MFELDRALPSPLRPLAPLLVFVAATFVIVSLCRVGLIVWQSDRVADAGMVFTLLRNGVRMDAVLISEVLLVPLLLILVVPDVIRNGYAWRAILSAWLASWLALIVILEVITPAYILFFDSRPGRIAFEYLGHPKEIAGLLQGAYRLETALAIILGTAAAGFMAYITVKLTRRPSRSGVAHRLVVIIPVILLAALAARSSLGHRPISPAAVAISNDQLINEIALSSAYKFVYSIYSLSREKDPGSIYPAMPEDQILTTVRAGKFIPDHDYLGASTLQHSFGRRGQPRNVVIIVEESLGARFVGALGGLPLTPHLDALSEQGIFFSRLYATGIRSARGLEAIVTGFPPTPARSVLKLGLAQEGFYTIAQSLRANGYRNEFFYGGESYFDNMKAFFTNNGFDEVTDVHDFTDPVFKGTWGVSDEDLFNRVHAHLSGQTSPFFTLVFSSSFHSPFEYPAGRIEQYDEPAQSKHNAVKYADYALGQFFDQAKTSDYWENTIFLIIADHDERAGGGGGLVSPGNFHIPAVILGAGIAPRRIDKVASQIDMLPTLLGLANIEGVAPLIGHNMVTLPADYPGRAIMQFGDNHGFLVGDNMVVHQPHLPPQQFRYRDGILSPIALDPALQQKALAMALLPGYLYRERLYKLIDADWRIRAAMH